MHPLATLDHQYLWHPFTQMRDWLKREPIILVKGQGTRLWDANGREYLDANSSIWTNLHGHRHPKINAAIRSQLKKLAHTSALGFGNEPASLLAAELVEGAQPIMPALASQPGKEPAPLSKLFFSDDGSTAMEVALKLAYVHCIRRGVKKPRFLSLAEAYHGDTIGAVSLGHIGLFHGTYRGLLFRTDKIPTPYCYRCRFNRAKPDRADAREYRRCNEECLSLLERKLALAQKRNRPYSGFIFEPLMQGAAGMIAQPRGWLRKSTEMAKAHGALLIADEVMTGFGRVGLGHSGSRETAGTVPEERPSYRGSTPPAHSRPDPATLDRITAQYLEQQLRLLDRQPVFACQLAGVQPDFLSFAKGLTGGYVPMAGTLTTKEVFNSFLGEYEEFKTFFHGHSFTANQVGASAALASLQILNSAKCLRARARLEKLLTKLLAALWQHPTVGDIRQVGLVAGIELVKNPRTREPFPPPARMGIRVCEGMAKRGVLTRPVGNVIVLMPPYSTTEAQLRKIISALSEALAEIESEPGQG